jgi:multidrug efflux system membrane fusion protein
MSHTDFDPNRATKPRNDHGGASASPARPSPDEALKKRKRGRGWLFLLFLAGIAGGYWYVHTRASVGQAHSAEADNPGKPGAGRKGPQEIPVIPATAAESDVPIYLDGLGTVQALNNVLVRSRVDGQIVKVAFTEGQDVEKGDLLVQIDPDPYKAALDQAQAKKHQDEAQLGNAKLDLGRNAELLKEKAISTQAYDTQRALVAQLEATVRADQAAINSAQVQLNYATITSPIAGRVGLRQVDEGNIVHASEANGIVTITQMRPIALVLTVPEQNLDEIRQQMTKGDVKVLALDRDNGPAIAQGKLTVIDNQIDATTGTVRLKAEFPNDDLRLWPGQFVNARLLLETRKNGITVPAPVVQRGPNGSFVFVIRDNLTVEVRPVNVNQIQDGKALIDEGLKPGERVVLEGQYRLQANSKVKISAKPANAKQGGGKPGESQQD